MSSPTAMVMMMTAIIIMTAMMMMMTVIIIMMAMMMMMIIIINILNTRGSKRLNIAVQI